MQETLTGSGKRWESSHQSTSGVAGSAALDSFRVPAHSPVPESFICTGSISHSIKFRIPADPGCCQGGDRWEWCFQLSPCWQQGPARQGRQQAQAAFIYFAVCLLIILWWFSTGMSVWWCSIMCWKCGASGQTPCSYLNGGQLGKGWAWGHFGALWASQKSGWCKGMGAEPNCKLLCSLLQRWDFVTALHWDLQSSLNPEGAWGWLVLGTGPLGWGSLEGLGAPGLAGWGCRGVHCSARLLQVWGSDREREGTEPVNFWASLLSVWWSTLPLCCSWCSSWIWAQPNSSQREDTNHLIRHEQFLIPVELGYIYSDELQAKGHWLVDSVL